MAAEPPVAGWRWAALAALALASPARASTVPDKPAPPVFDVNALQSAGQTLMTAAQKAQDGDCPGALTMLDGLRASAAFATLADSMKGPALDLGANCAVSLDRNEVAYSYALDGTKLAHPSPMSLRVSIWHAMARHQPALAIPLIETLATSDSANFNAIPIGWFYNIEHDLHVAKDSADQARLYATIVDRGYAPTEPGESIDNFRYSYAATLAVAGDKAKATAVFARITESQSQIRARVDRRLRGVVPDTFDARAVVEKTLAGLQKAFADHPDNLETVLKMAPCLRSLGRDDEALALLENNRPDGPQAAKFTDLKEHTNWWWNQLAYTYRALGRYDDAVAAMRSGAASGEDGRLNVSQTLNLAAMQVKYGHPADALKTLAGFEDAKGQTAPFGQMVLRNNRGCARFRTGDLAGAEADKAYVVAHEAESPINTLELLLCMGDLDAAAAVLIRRLDDPDLRADTLLELSDFEPDPHPEPDSPLVTGLPKLKARADVIAAIARAGGTQRFNVQ